MGKVITLSHKLLESKFADITTRAKNDLMALNPKDPQYNSKVEKMQNHYGAEWERYRNHLLSVMGYSADSVCECNMCLVRKSEKDS